MKFFSYTGPTLLFVGQSNALAYVFIVYVQYASFAFADSSNGMVATNISLLLLGKTWGSFLHV